MLPALDPKGASCIRQGPITALSGEELIIVQRDIVCTSAYTTCASTSRGVWASTCPELERAVPRPPSPPQRLPKPLAALRGDEQASWLCQGQEGHAPAILAQGWTGLVRRLAMECIDVATAPAALSLAEAWLLKGGAWHFGEDGSASWRIVLPDGAWAATLMTAGRSPAEAQRTLLG